MIRVYFFLDRRAVNKKKKELTILADVKYKVAGADQQFRFATGIACRANAFRNQVVFAPDIRAEEKNKVLNKIRDAAKDLYLTSLAAGVIKSPEDFKAALKSRQTEAKVEKTTLEHFESYIEFLKIKKKSPSFISAMKKMKEFLGELQAKGVSLHFDHIRADFEVEMLKLLAEKGFAPNTVGSYVKRLKTFLNYCLKHNLTTNHIFKNFEILEEATEIIALSEPEVEQIANLDLTSHKHVPEGGTKLTRDWFIISTQTGLRFSDFKKLADAKLTPVDGGFDIHLVTQKTKAPVVIPVSRLLYRVLKEYEFNVPPPPSNQKYNAGLERIKVKAELAKKITSHTGRKTFCTTQYRKGVPPALIMKISGHRTEREFYRYIGVDGSENANMVRQQNPEFQINAMIA